MNGTTETTEGDENTERCFLSAISAVQCFSDSMGSHGPETSVGVEKRENPWVGW